MIRIRNIPLLLWACFVLSVESTKRRENTSKYGEVYDLCIIGAGFFGTSAARHASAHKDHKICIIGLDEPSSEREYKERDIFSSNYDSGRVVKHMFVAHASQKLAEASIRQFHNLEILSGINFMNPVGFVMMGSKDNDTMRHHEDTCASAHTPIRTICDQKTMDEVYPMLQFQDELEYAIHDYAGTGALNPRKLIKAQLKVAKQQGCHIIMDKVENVKPLKHDVHVIVTSKHGIVRAKRVLFTTGAFTNVNEFDVLPELDMNVTREYAGLIRLPPEEAERLRYMPSFEYETTATSRYIVAPMLYPDGRYYIKYGTDFFGPELRSQQEIKDIFVKGGTNEEALELSKVLFHLLPGLKTDGIFPKLCILSKTPTSYPYIDQWTPTVTVAVGGNGWGATQSEEIARLAAYLSLFGIWDSEVPKSLFEIVTKDRQKRCRKYITEE